MALFESHESPGKKRRKNEQSHKLPKRTRCSRLLLLRLQALHFPARVLLQPHTSSCSSPVSTRSRASRCKLERVIICAHYTPHFVFLFFSLSLSFLFLFFSSVSHRGSIRILVFNGCICPLLILLLLLHTCRRLWLGQRRLAP